MLRKSSIYPSIDCPINLANIPYYDCSGWFNITTLECI